MSLDEINKQYSESADQADAVRYCELSKPYFDGNECIDCADELYFDISTKKCISCLTFNAAEHKCEETPIKPTSINFSAASKRLILPPG